jgi:hypothetical protein
MLRLEWVRLLTGQQEAMLAELTTAARWALSFALYGGIILGLCYAAREKIFAPAAVFCITLLAICFVYGVSFVLESQEKIPSTKTAMQPLGGPGLILSNPSLAGGTAIILLQGPSEAGAARLVATPGRPMVYQAEFGGGASSFARLQFGAESPWIFKSLAIDLRLSAENLKQRYNESLLSFLLYSGALIILLSSFWFIMNFSAWPLANLFLCCLAFRGVLALEILFNSTEMQETLGSFLQNRLPLSLAVPLIFFGIGLLAHLYSFLMYIAKRKSDYAF